jgi:hypothetical protein
MDIIGNIILFIVAIFFIGLLFELGSVLIDAFGLFLGGFIFLLLVR